MKINTRDLDVSITNKLNRLDSIVEGAYHNIEGYVSYDSELGFFFKRASDSYSKRIYEEDDFISMKKAIYHPEPNVLSSAENDMREDVSQYLVAASSFLVDGDYRSIQQTPENVRLFKVDGTDAITLDVAGNVTMTRNLSVQYSVDILAALREAFAFTEIEPFDISDIELFDGGFYVSVLETGIYRYRANDKTLEMVIAQSGIRKMMLIANGEKMFCVSDNDCTVNMIDSGRKIETFHNIKNAFQVPYIMCSEGRDIYIVGKTMIRNSDKLVHLWKRDIAGMNYNNKDGAVSTHKSNSDYEIRFAHMDKSYLYLIGVKHQKLFCWRYDRDYPHRPPEEEIFDCIDFSGMTGAVCKDGQYLVAIGKRLYGIYSNKVAMNLSFEHPIAKLEITDLGVLAVSNDHLISISIPEFVRSQAILSMKAFSSDTMCNNIDILVAGTDHDETIELYDENSKRISPTAMISHNGDTMIKLLNCQAKEIYLRIKVSAESSLLGIAVKQNGIFLR